MAPGEKYAGEGQSPCVPEGPAAELQQHKSFLQMCCKSVTNVYKCQCFRKAAYLLLSQVS